MLCNDHRCIDGHKFVCTCKESNLMDITLRSDFFHEQFDEFVLCSDKTTEKDKRSFKGNDRRSVQDKTRIIYA